MELAQDALSIAAELHKNRQYDRATELVQRRLAENPHDAKAWQLLGVLARDNGRLNFSAEALRQAIRLDDSIPAYHFDYALTVNRLEQLELALTHFCRAAELKPDYHDAVVNAGTVLHRLERLDEAQRWFERGIEINPRCAITWYNLGNIWQAWGRLDEAKRAYACAIDRAPDFAKAHWNKALCHLSAGEFADGWREFAWRAAAGEVVIDTYPQPQWRGEALAGRSILVHAEQGVGDEILFATCLPDLIAQAGRVVVVCEPRLAPLFERSFPRARFVGHSRRNDRGGVAIDEPIDFQAPLGDLPRYFRPDAASFPDCQRHLIADKEQVATWRERFVALGSGLKVGISWQAGGKPHERRKRSTTLADWTPVFAIPGVQFINVQYGERSAEIAAARRQFGWQIHDFDEGDPLVDIDEFAAKISALNLVISVGNTTVHLAGALGVPVWALVPTVPAWRWMIAGERTPWYSSVRAIRQTTPGDWSTVFSHAASRLRALLECGPGAPGSPLSISKAVRVPESETPLRIESDLKTKAVTSYRTPKCFATDNTLARALDRYRASDLQTAESLLNEILAHSPRNIRALHCLAQIARQTGRLDLAVRTLLRAASAGERVPAIWLDLARAQLAAGQDDEAIESYRHLVVLDPRHADGWLELAGALRAARHYDEAYTAYCTAAPLQFDNPKLFNFLGATCLELKRLDEAERAFRRAVELSPAYHAAWNNLGCALERQGKHDEAVACFERAGELDSNSSVVKINLSRLHSQAPQFSTPRRAPPSLSPELAARLEAAGQLYNQDRFEEADSLAREVLAAEPNHPVALRVVGVAARRAGRIDEAITSLRKATELDPKSFAILFELGVTYLERYQHKEAFDCFLRCHQLRPQFQPACINLAGILEQQERYEEALEWALKAAELNPDCYMAHYNVANNYRELGRVREAITHYERAMAINPEYVRADWNLGICHLHLGNYEQGWPRYENRMSAEEVRIDQFTEPRWCGKSLAEKTIVVHAEQGIGDEIVFSSCLPELIAKAGHVIVVCEPRLEKLFQRSFPQCTVYGYARRKNWAPCPLKERFDFQIPMGSLPLYLRPTRESFPRRERFLLPDPALVENWRKQFAPRGDGLKIGVSWRAGGKPLERRKRSVPLDLWGPIFGVPGAQFINLQYGDALDDAAQVRELFGVELCDWEQGDPLVDIDSFAAKVAALDLVISVGNATVHVAGGVGTPAWTLLPMVPSWRWMVEGDRSPWYTSVRLFRQPRRGDWPSVFKQIGRMLHELAASPPVDYRRNALVVHAPVVLDEALASRPAHHNPEWLDGSQICVKTTIDSIPNLMQQAEAHADRGELTEAEMILRRVLQLSPRFPSALHGLSRVARRQGNTELAIRSVKRALSTAEHVPERRCDLAAALADAGRHDEAAESYLRAIELDPRFYRAHYDLGLMLQKIGRHDEALARFEQAAVIQPENVAPAVARANSLRALCRPDEAIACLKAVLFKHLACAEALLLLFELYREDQSFADAEQFLRRALAAKPGLVEAELRLADLLAATGREEEAVACYERVIAQQPGHYAALVELGMLHDRLCRPADAEKCFRPALLECRDLSRLWLSSSTNWPSTPFSDASSTEKESDDKSSHSTHVPRELVNSLGMTLADQGRLDEALDYYDQALAISGDEPYPMAHANRAFTLLQLGRFAEGWREYEWRWRCPGAGRYRDHLRAPVWGPGAPGLSGRTILIHGEQGLGDEIMFATCYPDVIEQAAKTIITCEPRLERLFRRSFPAATIIAVVRGMEHQWQIPPRMGVDFHIAAGSLPSRLRPDEASFPRCTRLLDPDPGAVTHWRERFSALGPGLKIGVSWCAGDKSKERRLRSTRLQQWRPLLETSGCHFINLQHGDRAAEIDDLKRAANATLHYWRDADNRNDIDGLAARIAALDLVISVGNANIHLAGALGVPAWSLLPAHGGWRWLAGRSDTLWYASVRLFRQAASGDWEGLFLRVRQELLNHVRRSADQKAMPSIAGPHWAAFGGMSIDQVPMTKGK